MGAKEYCEVEAFPKAEQATILKEKSEACRKLVETFIEAYKGQRMLSTNADFFFY